MHCFLYFYAYEAVGGMASEHSVRDVPEDQTSTSFRGTVIDS